jgi:hypothetical protein
MLPVLYDSQPPNSAIFSRLTFAVPDLEAPMTFDNANANVHCRNSVLT